ncbi:calcium/sodium antiporter [Halobacterium yunchengense]|uniref:calcium/sodium antiporter n=1 Tax=Halobacterium yunchengense TaxID=3108497 RepID=UPI00300A7FB0
MPSAAVPDVALVAASVAGLWVGASALVAGAGRVARRLGVSGLVVGLTVVAFGTSAPEFAVTVDAALTAKPDISVGNVVGSNVVNLGFILGGVALVHSLPTVEDFLRRDGVALVGTTALALAFLADLRLTRVEGAVLVALLLAYLAVVVRTDGASAQPQQADRGRSTRFEAARALLGLVAVVASAHVLVVSAADLARFAGVSEWVVGVTVVAAGTSTPEFVASLAAARRGRPGLAAGNLVGSCVFNVLGVLGVAGVVRPLAVAPSALPTTAWLLATTVLVAAMFWTDRVLSRAEGAVLVALNAANWLFDVLA